VTELRKANKEYEKQMKIYKKMEEDAAKGNDAV